MPAAGDMVGRAFAMLALGGARVLPVAIMVPAFGGRHLPLQARLALGVLLAVLGWSAIAAAYDAAGLDRAGPLLLLLVAIRELAVGVAAGFVVTLAFHAAAAAGYLADVFRGAHAASVLAPAQAADWPSPLGALYTMLATVIFLEIGGLSRVVSALMQSYAAIPLGVRASSAVQMRNVGLVVALGSARLVAAALALAAPVLVASLLADLALGALARVAPQLPVHFFGLPVKGLLGVGVILVGLGAIVGALARGFDGWLDLVSKTLASFHP